MKHKPKNTENDQDLRKALMKILLDLNIDLPETENSLAILSLIEEENNEPNQGIKFIKSSHHQEEHK